MIVRLEDFCCEMEVEILGPCLGGKVPESFGKFRILQLRH